MFIKDINFQVEFTTFAESHFCKDFHKKYKKKPWTETIRTINDTLRRAYGTQRESSLIDIITYSQDDNCGLFKLDFRVAGSNLSAKASGNRVVFFLSNATGNIKILLVYCKDHCDKKTGENQWIFRKIRENFPEYKKYCN